MGPHFQRSRIRLKPKKKPLVISTQTKRTLIGIAAVIIVIGFVYVGAVKLMDVLGGTRLFSFFSGVVGKQLETDDQNHTNILLLGVGDVGHEGEDLTDTIIIASIDNDNNRVSLLSIPRDYYVKSSLGEFRINGLYEAGKKKWDSPIGLDFARETISDTFKVPLHYVVKVDFSAVEKVVDSFGGVDINVEQPISDPFYPKAETHEYEPFYLPAGMQHLDGETALKFARSRKTSSDFDRSHRQQQLIIAMKEKAKIQNKLNKSSFIKNLYYSLNNHVETTLGIREMLSLGSFAQYWDSKNLNQSTINDDPISKGGFLYTPDRNMFGGAFVLMSANDAQLKRYVHEMLYGDEAINKIPISILNGTKSNGLAAIVKQDLNRFGVVISRFGNARDQKITETTWFVNPKWSYSQTLSALNNQLQTSLVTFDEQGNISNIKDDHLKALIDFLNKLIPAPVKKAPQEYIDDPRFDDSALILELGTDKKREIDALELNYPLIIRTQKDNSASNTTATSDTSIKLRDLN